MWWRELDLLHWHMHRLIHRQPHRKGSPIAKRCQRILHEFAPCSHISLLLLCTRVHCSINWIMLTTERNDVILSHACTQFHWLPCTEKGSISICCGPKVHQSLRMVPSPILASMYGCSGFRVLIRSKSFSVGRPTSQRCVIKISMRNYAPIELRLRLEVSKFVFIAWIVSQQVWHNWWRSTFLAGRVM